MAASPSPGMTCEDVQGRLGQWYESELDCGDASRVEAHVSACPTCRDEVEAWRRIDLLLEVQISTEDLVTVVMEAVGRNARRGGSGSCRQAAQSLREDAERNGMPVGT